MPILLPSFNWIKTLLGEVLVASGRKREFDEEVALAAAMEVFWKKGYLASSLTDLTQNMGINKPSMYATFGNKESLFIKATEYYIKKHMLVHSELLVAQDQPVIARLKSYMMSIIANQCGSPQAKGCYLVFCQSELVSGDVPEKAAQLLTQLDQIPKATLVEFFNTDPQAQALGLNQYAESNALSLYTLLKGTASMARSGVSIDQLETAVDNILKGILAN